MKPSIMLLTSRCVRRALLYIVKPAVFHQQVTTGGGMKGLGDKITLCGGFIEDNSVLLGYYAASGDNSLPIILECI